MSDIKVSVVMAIYNGEAHLNKTIDDLLTQTLKEIEIICVNDGSTDRTEELLLAYAKKDTRLKVISQENQGAAVARNRGLAEATGEYLSILDADDFYEKDMLEIAYEACKKEAVDIGIFRGDKYDSIAECYVQMNYALRREMLPEKSPFTYHDINEYVFNFVCGWAWDKLFRREFIEQQQLQFQNTRTSNDLFFTFAALVKAKSIIAIDQLLIHHRVSVSGSLSVTREKSWDCFYVASQALKQELMEMGIYDEVEKSFLNWYLHFSFWNLDTLTGKSFKKVYLLIKNTIIPEIGLEKYEESFFRQDGLYQKAMKVSQKNSQSYMWKATTSKIVKILIYYKTYGLKNTIKQILNLIKNM